mgnify:CR=1 FL=1
MPHEIPDKLIMGCTHSSAEVNVHPEGPPRPKKFMFTIEAPWAKSKAVHGTCYVLAGLSALAESPKRIYDVFITKGTNAAHYYSVKILSRGVWREVIFDDYIPMIISRGEEEIAFSYGDDEEIWMMSLEKAWASSTEATAWSNLDLERNRFMTSLLLQPRQRNSRRPKRLLMKYGDNLGGQVEFSDGLQHRVKIRRGLWQLWIHKVTCFYVIGSIQNHNDQRQAKTIDKNT